jgi:hypothetical protein
MSHAHAVYLEQKSHVVTWDYNVPHSLLTSVYEVTQQTLLYATLISRLKHYLTQRLKICGALTVALSLEVSS